MTELTGDGYSVYHEEDSNTIDFEGSLRLVGTEEYSPISDLLDDVVSSAPDSITLNLKDLQFLNSSGINILSKFVIRMRDKKAIRLIIKGSSKIPWQGKSLKNLQRLMPSLTLEWE